MSDKAVEIIQRRMADLRKEILAMNSHDPRDMEGIGIRLIVCFELEQLHSELVSTDRDKEQLAAMASLHNRSLKSIP